MSTDCLPFVNILKVETCFPAFNLDFEIVCFAVSVVEGACMVGLGPTNP